MYKIDAASSIVTNVQVDDKKKNNILTDKLDVANNQPDPHEIMMSPDYSKYFVTCQNKNTVAVLDAHTDSLLGTIPVGVFPQDMAISKTKPYLFVTCYKDMVQQHGYAGSVYVINYNTLQVVKCLTDSFAYPHGITVDDKDGTFYIASTNANGVLCHESPVCSNSIGWYRVYDLNTLQRLPGSKKYYGAASPYSLDARFK